MRCKSCGSELELTRKPFIMNPYIPVLDVERLECPNCHERTFNVEQMAALAACEEEYERKRAQRLLERPLPHLEKRDWQMPDSDDAVDDLFEWVDGGLRVARLEGRGKGAACMSVATHRAIADAGFPALPMPLWELDGFCVEDMPTLQHVFRALDTEAFVGLLISMWKADSDDGDLHDELMDKLARLRTVETVSCDESPIVLLPRRVYTGCGEENRAVGDVEVSGYRFSFDAEEMASARVPTTGVSVEKLLGWKAWLALPGVRETYELMADLFTRLIASDVGDATLPPAGGNAYTQQLNEAADEDFREYLANLLGRMFPAEELVTITFEVDSDLLEKATVIMEAQGLTMQNAMNIAIHRLIAENS